MRSLSALRPVGQLTQFSQPVAGWIAVALHFLHTVIVAALAAPRPVPGAHTHRPSTSRYLSGERDGLKPGGEMVSHARTAIRGPAPHTSACRLSHGCAFGAGPGALECARTR